jgi:hypothetical protein
MDVNITIQAEVLVAFWAANMEANLAIRVKKVLLTAETVLYSPLDSIWDRGNLIKRCYREEMMI